MACALKLSGTITGTKKGWRICHVEASPSVAFPPVREWLRFLWSLYHPPWGWRDQSGALHLGLGVLLRVLYVPQRLYQVYILYHTYNYITQDTDTEKFRWHTSRMLQIQDPNIQFLNLSLYWLIYWTCFGWSTTGMNQPLGSIRTKELQTLNYFTPKGILDFQEWETFAAFPFMSWWTKSSSSWYDKSSEKMQRCFLKLSQLVQDFVYQLYFRWIPPFFL